MRLIDLLSLPVAALWQQKLRTMLTTLGVVFGAFVLAASLSIGQGVQETIDRESRRNDIARRVEVYPKWNLKSTTEEIADIKVEGEMSAPRRERFRKILADEKRRMDSPQVRSEITRERLRQIARLPHVARTVPMVQAFGFALYGKKATAALAASARPEDEACRRRLVAGRFFDKPDEHAVVVSEYVAYKLGMVGDAEIDGLVGKTIRLEFRTERAEPGITLYVYRPHGGLPTREENAALAKVKARLPGSLEKLGLTKEEADALRKTVKEQPSQEPSVYSEEFPVVGIVRNHTDQEISGNWDPLRVVSDVILPFQTATDLSFRMPGSEDRGVNLAVVTTDDEAHVKEVVKAILALGVEARAATEFIERERLIYLLIFGGMTCVAAVALLVSALGIANTMLMSVLERTREIGIMKAVGADNRHLLLVFVIEGGLIGLMGAGLGLLLAVSASYPGDAWVRSMVERDLKIALTGSIFVFPAWMALTVACFTVVVTTLAAVYPARHAARIDPVAALRHE